MNETDLRALAEQVLVPGWRIVSNTARALAEGYLTLLSENARFRISKLGPLLSEKAESLKWRQRALSAEAALVEMRSALELVQVRAVDALRILDEVEGQEEKP